VSLKPTRATGHLPVSSGSHGMSSQSEQRRARRLNSPAQIQVQGSPDDNYDDDGDAGVHGDTLACSSTGCVGYASAVSSAESTWTTATIRRAMVQAMRACRSVPVVIGLLSSTAPCMSLTTSQRGRSLDYAGVAPVAAPRAYRDDGPGTSRVGDEVGVTDGDLLRAISAANLARLAGAGADWTRLSGDILLRTPARLRTFALRIDLQRLVPSLQSCSGLTAGDIVQLERV